MVQDKDVEGNPVGEPREVRKRYYEKGSGINYNVAPEGEPAVWEKTDKTIRPSTRAGWDYMVETGPAKVYFAPWQSGSLMAYEAGGVRMETEIVGLVYYDASSERKETVAAKAETSSPVVDGNRIVYPEAFPGIALEFVYDPASFHQNLIIKRREAVPPLPKGMNPEQSYLMLESRLVLPREQAVQIDSQGDSGVVNRYITSGAARERGLTATATVGLEANEYRKLEGRSLALEFKQEGGPEAFRIAEGKAWSAQGGKQQISIYKVLHSDGESDQYLDGVPHRLLQEKATDFPVVVDPVYEISGACSGKEVWSSGQTYYISDTYTVSNGSELVIEPGAIVKVQPDEIGIIVQNEGRLVASGEPRKYVIFASAADDSVGEPVDCEDGNYTWSWDIEIRKDASPDSCIEYCKFSGCYDAMWLMNSLSKPVQHNILRLGEEGFGIASASSLWGSPSTVVHNIFFNNLIVGGEVGILLISEASGEQYNGLYHNTLVDQAMVGFGFAGDRLNELTKNLVDMQNNLIVNSASDAFYAYDVMDFEALDPEYFGACQNNAYFNCGTEFTQGEVIYGTRYTGSPFLQGIPNGDFYLDPLVAGAKTAIATGASGIHPRFQKEMAKRTRRAVVEAVP